MQNIEKWLEDGNFKFTHKSREIKFFSIYEGLKNFLLPKHDQTTKGAIIKSIEDEISRLESERDKLRGEQKKDLDKLLFDLKKIIWLNDHGAEHIETVIRRASALIKPILDQMSPREVFILLSAIHLHDLGNFYGRSGHEQKIMDVVKEGSSHIGTDQIERKHILQVAEVHGGYIPGSKNKDTISKLKTSVPIYDDDIRLKFLAAVLRFADEIADDESRADKVLLSEGKLPKGSEVFHAYSASLYNVKVDHNTASIELHFHIHKDYLMKKFGKLDGEVFLIEEIYERVLKMHDERIYCSRFWKSNLDLENILVIINFYSDTLEEEVHPEVSFTLNEHGYPKNHHDIFEMCPNLTVNSNKLDGNYFLKYLNKE